MSRYDDAPVGKLYVGGLPADARPEELEDVFNQYGRLRKVWVARRPPGFAFVEFEDPRDAEDAVRALDGARICGQRARVEISSGRRRDGGSRDDRGRGDDRRGGRGGERDYGYKRASRSRSPRRERTRSPRSRTRSPVRRDSRSPSRSRSPK